MQRETRQRGAIRNAFEKNDAPLLPAEILKLARQSVPSISLATVYRTLNAFSNEGLVKVVSLPGEPARYEKSGKSHHHHFVCRECGRVFEVHACMGSMRKMAPAGFQVENHEITLYGLCRECAG